MPTPDRPALAASASLGARAGDLVDTADDLTDRMKMLSRTVGGRGGGGGGDDPAPPR